MSSKLVYSLPGVGWTSQASSAQPQNLHRWKEVKVRPGLSNIGRSTRGPQV